MEIIIPLPDTDANNYKNIKAHLKQLELAVHHAQKAVEAAENEGIAVTEDASVYYEHPNLNEEVATDLFDELQNVNLRISLR